MANPLPIPSSHHTSDHPVDLIQEGLETILQNLHLLRDETEALARTKSLFTVHIHQYETDIAHLRHIYKSMKSSLDVTPSFPTPFPPSGPLRSDLKYLAHAEIPWRVTSTDSFYDRGHVRLRYALRLDAILCTIRFNGDGSLFSFTNGATVFLILTADGSLIGTCDLPKARNSADGHTRAICFSPDSRYLAVSGPGSSVTVIEVASRRVVKTLDAHTGDVSTVTFFRGSHKLITGGFDRKLCVWTTRDWKMVKVIQHGGSGKDENIVAVAIAGD
jgi:hypothetical protein